MFGKFLPKEYKFYDYFEKHAALIVQSSQELLMLVSPDSDILAHSKRIQALEHEADQITHYCVEALHKTFITPFERNEIYQLIAQMDDIIDFIEDTAERIVLYKLTEMTSAVYDLADVLVRSTKELEPTVKGLRKMKNIDYMRRRFVTIKHLENESDLIVRRAVGQLFEEEKNPLLVIKWKEIYENLESAVDRCEDVANIIEGVILEYS